MRHNVDGRKFGRNTSHRVAMLKNLANAVIEKEQIVTTVQKAKEARRLVDRLVTLAKKGDLASRRLAFGRTRDNDVVKKLFSVLADRYKSREGGYTRVLRVSDRRWGDAAEMAVLELVDHPVLDRKRKPKAAAPAADSDKDAGTDAKASDPFGRFRKMFDGGRSKVTSQAGKASKSSKSSAGRKAPAAGGGSSKAGSSS